MAVMKDGGRRVDYEIIRECGGEMDLGKQMDATWNGICETVGIIDGKDRKGR